MAKVIVKKKKLPEYPPDHKVGMKVPLDGSDCEKCEYLKANGECGQPLYIEWNGSGKLGAPPNQFCCDFFEAEDKK